MRIQQKDTDAQGSILLINSHDFPGGAAISTHRLAQALQARRYAVHILVGHCKLQHSHAHCFRPRPEAALAAIARDQGLLYYHLQGSHGLVRHPSVRRADILHLQNTHGDYFNPYSLPALSAYKPAVWTLRDMWALTGHCAHALDCPKWETGCGRCPDLTVYPSVSADATARLWQDKRAIYEHSRLWIVCPSQWLADKVARSILRTHPVSVIMNAVDTAIFRPQDRTAARRRFHLPEDAVIMGTSAQGGLDNLWKGSGFALEAALALHTVFPSALFVAAGGKESAAVDCIRQLPHLNSEEEMALYHSCLDFTLFTSIADTCPLTLIESLSCGTPVVGFATGGAPEIVRDGQDGIMTPVKDVQALVRAAALLIAKPALREKMGQNAARDAPARFSLERLGADHAKLYEEVSASSRPAPPRLPPHLVPALIRTPEYVRMEEAVYGA